MNKYLEAWNQYLSLENEFKQIIEHIPLEDNHLDVWSLKIGSLLIVLGSVVDSFFKLAIKDSELDGVTNINRIRSKRQITIQDYKMTFDKYYQIRNKNIYIRVSNNGVQPFTNWTNKTPPQWWRAYQEVKHDKFMNKEKATLRQLRDGLAGLFLIMLIHIPSRKILCRLKLWKSYNCQTWAPSFLEDMLLTKEPVSEQDIFYIQTELFGYILNNSQVGTDVNSTWRRVLGLLREPRF